MRGPYLITALPDDLSALTTELFSTLHRATLLIGGPFGSGQKFMSVDAPPICCFLAVDSPTCLRMTISSLPGMLMLDDAVMILLTEDGNNYVLWDSTVSVEAVLQVYAILKRLPEP